MFRIFRGKNPKAEDASADHLQLARDAWQGLLKPDQELDVTLGHLCRVLSSAQLVACEGESVGYLFLGAGHLAAAAMTHVDSMPSEVEARCVGHAAVAIARLHQLRGSPSDEMSRNQRLVEDRFKFWRGRIRGSIMVPRDVEYAFEGRVEGLEAMALSPDRFQRLQDLLREGAAAALVDRTVTDLRQSEPASDISELRAAAVRLVRQGTSPFTWDPQDRSFIQAFAAFDDE